MHQIYDTGGGCVALRVTEHDAPLMYGLVTNTDGNQLSSDFETESMNIGIYEDNADEHITLTTLVGRAGLNAWYLENVGYDPSAESDPPIAILELVDDVVSHILLRAFESQILDR